MRRNKTAISVRDVAKRWLAMSVIASAPAFAQQTTPSGTGAGEGGTLSEIVVTAEKREGTIQNTPMSISAFSEEELKKSGISSVEEIAEQTPGLSFESTGPSRTQYTIRGMSSNGGAAPTVGFYLDDTPITPPIDSTQGKNFIDPDLYDLARVEILRGPQGTLYGSSSMGGTIRLITNQPVLDQLQASAKAVLGGTDHGGFDFTTSGMINIPLVDNVIGVRLIATETHNDGYIDRVVQNPFPLPNADGTRGNVLAAPIVARYGDVNNENSQTVRLLVTLAPDERLTITPSVFWQETQQGGEDTIDEPPGTFTHYQPFDISEPFHDNFALSTLLVKYNFDGAQLSSSTAFFQRHSNQFEDESETYYTLFGQSVGFPYFAPARAQESQEARQLTEETRLTSTGAGPFQWVGGLFFSHFSDTYFSGNAPIPSYAPIFGTDLVLNYSELDKISQEALFGEVSYKVLPKLKATLGVRYLRYTDSFNLGQEGFLTPPGLGISSGSSNGNKVTPKVSLDYTPSSDVLFYLTAASGTRPGAANLPIPTSGPLNCGQASPQSYSPDSIWSYEIGEKVRTLGNRLTVNSSLFYIDWSNVQQQVYLACGYNYTTNLGHAISKGGEIELQAELAPSLILDQNFGYTRAEITSTGAASSFFIGEQLQNVPKYTMASSLEYSKDLTAGLSLSARLSNSYVSASMDRGYKPPYDLVAARFGVHSAKFDSYLFVDNATDRLAILANATSLSVNIPELNRVAINRPRTIGVDLNYRF
jgi:iron complex outermembrane recepter protein